MLRFFKIFLTLRRALADERRTVKALCDKCGELLAYQERITSNNRYISQQNIYLTHENTRELEKIAELKAELHNLHIQHFHDEHGGHER